jgi:hypothetical protein
MEPLATKATSTGSTVTASGEPAAVAHYPSPGLRRLCSLPQGPIRGAKRTTNGKLYVVAGAGVYSVASDWTFTHLGDITAGRRTPVSIADNGITAVIVDGTPNGWTIDLTSDAFAPLPKTYPQFQAYDATIVTPGIAYSVGDKLLALTGTPITGQSAAEFTVTTIDANGAVTGLTNSATCTYSVKPNDPTPFSYDGAGSGLTVHLLYKDLTIDSPFVGADRVDYLDTYFIFNKPGTPQFYISLSLDTAFDPLDFANKESFSDLLMAAIVSQRQLWLIGNETTEIWTNVGAQGSVTQPDITGFTFQIIPGTFVDRGTIAKYSVAETDGAIYWLTQDRGGTGSVLETSNYTAKPVSTFAITNEFAKYPRLDDAIGMCYQIGGHRYYVLTFPSADKTWCYDITTQSWSELVWLDTNGTEHRHRANCAFTAYNEVVCGDWENGNLYAYDLRVFTDDGAPVLRLRNFPHMISDMKRQFFRSLILDIEGGAGGHLTFPEPPQVFLSWSDDRGHSFSNPVGQDLGETGDYVSSVNYQRLGLGRDRIFRVFWSTPYLTCLQGCYLEVTPAAS